MNLAFRWYGESDPVKLEYIRQIPNVSSVVTAVYDVPAGEVWSRESIAALAARAAGCNLKMDVIESVPVHEDIKLGLKTRDKYIDVYVENLLRLGEAGVKCVCYNFMPVFDWTRTTLDKQAFDGSFSLAYSDAELKGKDPKKLSLPGWDVSYKKERLAELFDAYSSVSEERLFYNLVYFLEAVIPAAEKAGIVMAIHPDDPPWPIFGLPRIVTDEHHIDRLLAAVNSRANGLTLCTGSLGSAQNNDIARLAAKYASKQRVHFVHARNVKLCKDGFEETAHASSCGSLDMVEILKALYVNGFDGYIRPDHGRMIWGETGRAGYGLYDRALGLSYVNGIWETLEKTIGRKI